MADNMQHQSDTVIDDQQHIQYSIDFTRTMTALEAQLHSCEDPAVIAMDALKVGAAFYDADWCGVIEGDLEMDAWAPVLWYNVSSRAMTETQFRDLEETKNLERWVEALYACKPVIIPDTSVYKDSNPGEYALYERCRAKIACTRVCPCFLFLHRLIQSKTFHRIKKWYLIEKESEKCYTVSTIISVRE